MNIARYERSRSIIDDGILRKVEVLTFQKRVGRIIDSTAFSIGIITLVVFECVLVMIELYLDMVQPSKSISIAKVVIRDIGFVILCIFVIEICGRIYVLRSSFFKSAMEVFDALVITISLFLDILFHANDTIVMGSELIIVLRLWRVTRIINGIIVAAVKKVELMWEFDKKRLNEYKLRYAELRIHCSEQEKEISKLKHLLARSHVEGYANNEDDVVYTGFAIEFFSKVYAKRISDEV